MLLNIIDTNQVGRLPITREDVKRAENIFGLNIFALKGMTKNRKVDHMVDPITKIPKEILKKNQKHHAMYQCDVY